MRIVRWVAGGAGVLAVGAAAVVALGLWLGEQRITRHYEVPATPLPLRDDSAALERGRYLYASRGCMDCHGEDGGGATLVRNDDGLHLAGPNITVGNPRIAAYQPIDWDRSLRHGVAPDGRALRLMPSEDYARLTDEDAASLVAHVRRLPAKTGAERGTIELPLPGRVLYGFGAIPEAVHKIDHRLPPPTPVPETVSIEHGQYVAQMCVGCHGRALEGGRIPGAPPDWPPAARLAPGPDNGMAAYADAGAFVAMMRSGQRPDGRPIAVMPFASIRTMNDTDLLALHRYLTGLPSR